MFKRIPYVDLARQHAPLKAELLAAVAQVLDSGHFMLGPAVSAFEQSLASLCESKYAVGLNSGTDALILALRALKIGPGDEVILQPNSFVATASAVVLVGATPVFVDVGPDYNLNPDLIEAAITPKTKAIIPVHLTGKPAAMGPIMKIAQAFNLHVIEDSAQAILAEYQNQRVGSFGIMGAFSLHPLKTLNACGDGGALTTSDPSLYEQLKDMRSIGLRTRDDCVMWSGNSRLDTIQAAMLMVKLPHLEHWTLRRRENAAMYRELLEGIPQIQLPLDSPDERQVYHTFIIQAESRDALKASLMEQGVEAAIHYPIPIHLHKAAAELGYSVGSFPVAERQAKHILSLPVYPELTADDLEYIADCIKRFYRS